MSIAKSTSSINISSIVDLSVFKILKSKFSFLLVTKDFNSLPLLFLSAILVPSGNSTSLSTIEII